MARERRQYTKRAQPLGGQRQDDERPGEVEGHAAHVDDQQHRQPGDDRRPRARGTATGVRRTAGRAALLRTARQAAPQARCRTAYRSLDRPFRARKHGHDRHRSQRRADRVVRRARLRDGSRSASRARTRSRGWTRPGCAWAMTATIRAPGSSSASTCRACATSRSPTSRPRCGAPPASCSAARSASSSPTRGATASSPTSASGPIARGSRRRRRRRAGTRTATSSATSSTRPSRACSRSSCGRTSRSAAAARSSRPTPWPRWPGCSSSSREGVLPDDFPYDELIAQCSTFVETTGRLGDVVLMHPYMLHAVSQNHRGTARFITNPPIALKAADALRPRRPRRALPGRARRAARAWASSGWTTGPRPRARTSCPSACAARSACASEEEARLAEAAS